MPISRNANPSTKVTIPLSSRHGYSIVSYLYVVLFVVCLNLPCVPTTVHRPLIFDAFLASSARVVPLVVDPFYREFRTWPAPHVASEVNVVAPSLANFSTLLHVASIARASVVDSSPNGELWLSGTSRRCAMSSVCYFGDFDGKTSARSAFPADEVSSIDFTHLSAFTLAFPNGLTTSGGDISNVGVSDNFPSSKYFSSKVNKFCLGEHLSLFASTRVNQSTPQMGSEDAFLFSADTSANPSRLGYFFRFFNFDHLKKPVGFSDEVRDRLLVLARKFRADDIIWGLAHGYNMLSDSSGPCPAPTGRGCAPILHTLPSNARRIT